MARATVRKRVRRLSIFRPALDPMLVQQDHLPPVEHELYLTNYIGEVSITDITGQHFLLRSRKGALALAEKFSTIFMTLCLVL